MAMDTTTLRAATTLVPQLRAAGATRLPHVWRGADWIQAEAHADARSTGFALLDQELPGQGWPRGQLVELLVDQPGIGELGLLLPALAAVTHAGRSCVWVLPCPGRIAHPGRIRQRPAVRGHGAHALPYAPALVEAGIDLARNIFVKPLTTRESGWALEQSLRTAHLGALLGWLPDSAGVDADFRALRRLHLLAQRHQALVFILRPTRCAQAPSPAALRLHLHNEGGQLQVRVLKRRGRPLLEPVTLQIHPARWNRKPTTLPGPAPVPSPAADTARPASAARNGLLHMVQALAPKAGWPMPAALTPPAIA